MKQPTKFTHGDPVRHALTGFTGVVVCKAAYASGTNLIGIQPTKLKDDGSAPDADFFEEAQCNEVKDRLLTVDEFEVAPQNDSKFNLLDKVKSNFVDCEGVITSISWWINGCIRYRVQVPKLHEGKVVEVICDEYELELLTATKVEVKPHGGPERPPRSVGR